MAYANYAFYEDNYLMGRTPVIPTTEFNFYAEKATRAIKHETLGKSETYIDDDTVKICTCALAEKYYNDAQQDRAQGASNIASEQVGEYKVTYTTGKSAIYKKTEAVTIIREYLGVTGLLYRGIN